MNQVNSWQQRKFLAVILAQLLALFILNSCHYDASPPSESKLHDDRPVVYLILRGFQALARVSVTFWDDEGMHHKGLAAGQHLDSSGSYRASISLSHTSLVTSIMIQVDQDLNQNWGTSDLGYTILNKAIPPYNLEAPERIMLIELHSSDFQNLIAVIPASAMVLKPGRYDCILSPAGQIPWTSDSSGAKFSQDKLEKYYPFADWGMSSAWQVTASQVMEPVSIQMAFVPELPVNIQYSGNCILDANGNGYYDSGEEIYSILPFTVIQGLSNEFLLP